MKSKTTGDLKHFEGRKRTKDFIAIYKDGKLVKIILPDNEKDYGLRWWGYILPRKIDRLDDFNIDECSNCGCYFPDGLDECEHCNEKFCCDCADEHADNIDERPFTGGCRF